MTFTCFQFCSGALDEFDCISTERNGQQEHAPGIPAAEGGIEPQEQENAVDDKKVSSGPGKGPKFNPLGRKPKKKRAPDIDDLRNVSPEEVEESTKELSAMLQNMMKGTPSNCELQDGVLICSQPSIQDIVQL